MARGYYSERPLAAIARGFIALVGAALGRDRAGFNRALRALRGARRAPTGQPHLPM